MTRWLVTGGLGFIGSAFARRRIADGDEVVSADLETYAASRERLPFAESCQLRQVDVASDEVVVLIRESRPDALIHFAAETHVTRSETDADTFYRTNVDGTRKVLEAAVAVEIPQIIHISTDEVYGPCLGDAYKEEDKAPGDGQATSAYAKSKSIADDIATAMGPPVRVVRLTNCYGPWQHPEKAVARWMTKALRGERLPVWGAGQQRRDWLHVEDACAAIDIVTKYGDSEGVYNISAEGPETSNLKIAGVIADLAGLQSSAVYLTQYDRPDHDERYALDAARLRTLGWKPELSLVAGLRSTLDWYAAHRDWWEPMIRAAERIYEDSEVRR